MIRGSFYILLFYFLGEMLSKLIGGFVPGSVLGMVLSSALYFKAIKPESVKDVATSITKNMAVFFVPAGVGLMVYAELGIEIAGCHTRSHCRKYDTDHHNSCTCAGKFRKTMC